MTGTPRSFALSVETADDHATVRVTGEIDMESSPALRSRLLSLAQMGIRQVTLDMTDTEFIDSTGLHVLVVALNELKVQGGDLVLQSPSRSATRLLHLTGVDTLMQVV
jgi:anti-sigma B factor antagonist